MMERLLVLYLNEKNTRMLLPYGRELVHGICYLLEKQRLKLCSLKDAPHGRVIEHAYKMEIDRVEWVLKEYLLRRLEKIRGNFYLQDQELSLLSGGERRFYAKYLELNRAHGVYMEGPPSAGPAPAEYGGFYVLEDLGNHVMENEVVGMAKGDFYIGNLREVSGLLQSARILIP